MENQNHCCAACAAMEDHHHKETGTKLVSIGSYSLPLRRVLTFAAALLCWIAGFVLLSILEQRSSARWPALIPLLAAYALAGIPVLINAAKNIAAGHALDENFLMAIATIGAFVVGDWEEAAGVMIFYMIGELVQDAAVFRSRSSINALLALKPDTARIETASGWQEVPADSVEIASKILVRPGERIPLDGVVIEGSGSVDASMLTGESMPVPRTTGDEVRSGTVSLDGVLVIKSTKTAGNSSAAKIIELVEKAKESKSKPERFITAFARWYTPAMICAAVLLAVIPPMVTGQAFATWLYRALILLVISCPCALVVSVPLGYFAGIGGMSARGIMVKGALALDSLRLTKCVAFDKTGTLTEGTFVLQSIECAPGFDEKTSLATAALAEQESNHPIAQAIQNGAREYGVPLTQTKGGAGTSVPAARVREIAGYGIEYTSEEAGVILAGNRRLLEMNGVTVTAASEEAAAGTPVYIAKDGRYCGRLFAGDAIKEGAPEAVRQLAKIGITQTVMLTGDADGPARLAAARIGISDVASGLLPEDKLTEIEKLTKRGVTVFVGDGINDAPVLARSDVGIAMGSGADAAVEAADVIIMTGDPRRVPEAIERARKTRRIVIGNVLFALGAKAVFITLAVLGIANMWMAITADVGVAAIAILNSTRAR
jgi:Cd2+/Zn2+-exporting ATPase